MVELSEQQMADIHNFGALQYPIDKIISILEIQDPEEFKIEFNNKESAIFKKYHSGRDEAQYKIDMRIFELARSGDMKAIQMYNRKLKSN
jgi:hypothetical protein